MVVTQKKMKYLNMKIKVRVNVVMVTKVIVVAIVTPILCIVKALYYSLRFTKTAASFVYPHCTFCLI